MATGRLKKNAVHLNEIGCPAALIVNSGLGHVFLLTFESQLSGIIYYLSIGPGGWVTSPLKGWRIRVDSGRHSQDAPKHVHCFKDNEEYVVTFEGKGSHDTLTGTKLPKKLGKYLHEQAGIPLETTNDSYVVRFLPGFPSNPVDERVWIINLFEKGELVDLVGTKRARHAYKRRRRILKGATR